MAIVAIQDGGTILESDFTTSFEAVRTEVNAMTSANVRRRCFGPQHLPGIIAAKTGGNNYGREIVKLNPPPNVTVNTGFTALMSGTKVQQEQDITTNWQTILTANGGGAGFQLPNCHVFFWASIEIPLWVAQAASGDYALAGLTYAVNGGAEAMVDAADFGFVLCDTTSVDARYGYHHITIHADLTMAAGTLNYVRLRAAKDPAGANFEISQGNLGMVAFMWDQ